MIEVEMKFPAADFADLERRLAAWGAEGPVSREDIDHYFNPPGRDYARTDEAFRLRLMGTAAAITYKGPKRDAQTKTREEIEVQMAEGEQVSRDCLQLLDHLGFRPVGVVRKTRQRYHVKRQGFPLEVCLDEVEGLGRFAELEIVTSQENLESARNVLLEAAAELGLTASERRSYLQLLLTAQGEKAT